MIIICSIHGEFEQTPSSHVHGKQGCMSCMNKTEGLLRIFLEICGYNVIFQFSPDWLNTPQMKRKGRFDFCISDLKLIIELDGEQHFSQVSDWESPQEIQRKDTIKTILAIENGYTIIRLLQKDVYKNKNNWKQFVENNMYERGEPEWVYSDKEKYKSHEFLMDENYRKKKKTCM